MSRPENTDDETEVLLNHSIGAASRKKIMKTLLIKTKNCSEIAREVKLNWRTSYRHLQILEKENLVRSIDFGQRKFYRLTLKGEEAIGSIKNKNTLPKTKKKDIHKLKIA